MPRARSLIIAVDESGRCRAAELFAGKTAAGVNKDVLDGLTLRDMIAAYEAGALRGPQVNPFGGFVAGAAKAGTAKQAVITIGTTYAT
jgi:hypothetical protein